MENTNYKEYWENYTDYWVQRVSTTNDKSEKKDRTLDDEILGTYLKKLDINKNHKVLDFGCGFCRIYPYYKEIVRNKNNNYMGVDIAEAPLRLATKIYPELKFSKQLLTYDGDIIPFESNTFDRIICFGVFDACNQEKILAELIRILNKNGKLLITGKNDLYFTNDEAAYVAEVNARKKGHPNYFTNVGKMITYLKEQGIVIDEEYYFQRRGDFSANKFSKIKTERFYEWMLVVKKVYDKNIQRSEEVFSSKFSKTYNEKKQGEKV